MLIVDEIDNGGPPRTPRPAIPLEGGGEIPAQAEADDVIRLGDSHVSGVESLCVGESQ